MCGRFCRFKIDFKSGVAFALHEVGHISAADRDNYFQITRARLRSVNAERDGLAHNTVRYVCYTHSVRVVRFHQERATFDMSQR